MAYITRNANLILLFCVVLALTFLVGTTVFYQTNLDRINSQYEQKVTQLKQVEKELNTKIKILDRVRRDLKLKAEREESFTEKYTEIRGEKETLEEARARLEHEVEQLRSELDDAKAAKEEAEASAEFERRRNEELTAELDRARDEADEWKNRYDTCQASLNQCTS